MKKLSKILFPLMITLAVAGCNNKNSPKDNYQNIKDLTKTIWDADTLIKKDSSESIYEKFLPDSILNSKVELDSFGKRKFVTSNELEMEYLDLKNQRLKHYNNFLENKDKNEALKSIAYSQYLAIRFAGNSGKELKESTEFIKDITKKLED
jgi:hypothetical protein